jgi:hypothetical protein
VKGRSKSIKKAAFWRAYSRPQLEDGTLYINPISFGE